ncbi:MarR family winged helix-turn-helix transcriptional regulator [Nocardioides sp. CFH 31398]|uniref:MarR family winged helix-turn-helix transcriptional regulator n=1 Tax=Nocardioides sp. CFH 31398 TaxID=2919579 RepID=UPI001F070437|nr:MarR family winged helix-turn-helix transcriptional regulator [Nocardioides sp. CFH 31398]MCH1866664.1 MarR family winged helix-turn-helix transcriptional regulator [Nocardioides sp. CFH 31398]
MSRVNGSHHVAALLAALLDDVRAAHGRRLDLRVSHLRVLDACPPDGAGVGDLAARLGMTAQGCGQLVNRLVDSGHVEVRRDPDDGRARRVLRTAAGDRALTEFEQALVEVETAWSARVGAGRYAAFREVLTELGAGG